MLFGDAEAFCFRDCVAKMLSFVHHFSLIDKALSLVFDKRPHRSGINDHYGPPNHQPEATRERKVAARSALS
jgi:hypothetical protein